MKPEDEVVIEAMASAMSMNGAEGDDDAIESDAIAALRAAAERGWVLARLPERPRKVSGPGGRAHPFREGYIACLDAIETIELGNVE